MRLAHELSQRAEQRCVWQLAVGLLDGVAAQHQDLFLGEPPCELVDQPRLSDARLTAEQDECRASPGRLAGRQFEFRQLADATDEAAAGQSRSHA